MKDPINEVNDFLTSMKQDHVDVEGVWRFTTTRANGDVEEKVVRNTVTKYGLDILASRAIADTSSPYGFIAVGTHTNAASLGSVLADLGEVDRKVGATITTSKSTVIMVATFGGAADGLTGIVLASGAMCNHVNSGSGEAFNIVNSVDTTLAASDTVQIQCEVQVGSHNL